MLERGGVPSARISEMEADLAARRRAAQSASGTNGGEGFISGSDMGQSQYDLMTSDPTSTAASTASANDLSSQIGGMFTGDDAIYNIADLMRNYTDSVAAASDQYDQSLQGMRERWRQFVSDWDNNYGSMSNQYDDLNADYDANRERYSENYNRYNQQMGGIPQLNLTLPGGMGGGSFALAPKNWTNVYSTQANTNNQILANQLDSIKGKKSAYDSKASLLQPWATAQGTGITNQNVADQARMQNAIQSLQEQFKPFSIANDWQDRQKQLDAKVSLAQQQIDNDQDRWESTQPNWFDRFAPIIAEDIGSKDGIINSAIDAIKGWF
jgi:hypothetical protein